MGANMWWSIPYKQHWHNLWYLNTKSASLDRPHTSVQSHNMCSQSATIMHTPHQAWEIRGLQTAGSQQCNLDPLQLQGMQPELTWDKIIEHNCYKALKKFFIVWRFVFKISGHMSKYSQHLKYVWNFTVSTTYPFWMICLFYHTVYYLYIFTLFYHIYNTQTSTKHLWIWSFWYSSISSHIPVFFLSGTRFNAPNPHWAEGRTEPETVQPGAWKLHGGPETAHQYLLSASHINNAKEIQELQSSTKPSLIQSCWLATMWVQCKSDRCSKFSVLFWVCCCKTALRLWAVWRVIVSRVELDQECRREWQLSEHQHFIHTCPLPHQRGHTLWAIQSGSN